MDVAAAPERRAGRVVAEVVEQLAAPAAVAGRGVMLDRAVGLPAAVGRRPAQLRDLGAIEPARGLDADAAALAGRELDRSRALGDREQDARLVVAGVELGLAADPADQARDLIDGHLGLLDEAHEPAEVAARREQDRLGGQAVAAGAARLLVVRLEG